MPARNEADEKNVLSHLIFLALSLIQAYKQTLLFPFPVFKLTKNINLGYENQPPEMSQKCWKMKLLDFYKQGIEDNVTHFSLIFPVNHFSQLLRFIQKPVIYRAKQMAGFWAEITFNTFNILQSFPAN